MSHGLPRHPETRHREPRVLSNKPDKPAENWVDKLARREKQMRDVLPRLFISDFLLFYISIRIHLGLPESAAPLFESLVAPVVTVALVPIHMGLMFILLTMLAT